MYSSVSTDVAYKFTSQEFDDENGLYNFRARMYDAELGMFYAYDPAMQGFSPFGYCGNNPVMYIDKDGRLAWWVIPVVVGVISGGINVAIHWDEIQQDGWAALPAFGIGFAAGFVGTYSAGQTFVALGGTALGGGGYTAGSIAAMMGYNTYTATLAGGNLVTFGDPPPTAGQYFAGLFLANVTGGLTNGLTAVANGRNFFTGNLNTSVIDATTVATTNLPSGLSDPKVAKNFLDATDEDFVHVTNNLGKQNILKPGSGLDPDISGYVTKWKYVKDITNPTDFSKVLFRQDLWNSPDILNRFNEGAWILKINAPFRPEYFSPFTNIINGVPQWRYLDFINNSYISPIRFLGF